MGAGLERGLRLPFCLCGRRAVMREMRTEQKEKRPHLRSRWWGLFSFLRGVGGGAGDRKEKRPHFEGLEAAARLTVFASYIYSPSAFFGRVGFCGFRTRWQAVGGGGLGRLFCTERAQLCKRGRVARSAWAWRSIGSASCSCTAKTVGKLKDKKRHSRPVPSHPGGACFLSLYLYEEGPQQQAT